MLDVQINHVKLLNDDNPNYFLKDISFSLEIGKIYTILGENGAGKSTLVKLLTKLLDGRFFRIKARVLFHNKDILSMQDDTLRQIRLKKIRYVFQDSINSFDPLKTFNYYFQLTEADDASIDELLEYFLLPEKEKLYGLYPYEISGGMAQRVNLILALLVKPELLILDEPTSSTDIPIANLIRIKLCEFIEQNPSSVLIITQDLRFAGEVSDQIAYLNNGLLSKFHSAAELFNGQIDQDFQNFKNKLIGP